MEPVTEMLKMNKTVEIPLNEWYCNNSKGNGGKAKRTMIKFENIAKVAIVNKNGETNPYIGTEKDDSSNYLTFKMWKKNGYKRIYVNDYQRRTVAYIDCNANNSVESEYSKGNIIETIKYFIENYEF